MMNTRHPSLPCPKLMPVWLKNLATIIRYNTTIPLNIISCKIILYHIFYSYYFILFYILFCSSYIIHIILYYYIGYIIANCFLYKHSSQLSTSQYSETVWRSNKVLFHGTKIMSIQKKIVALLFKMTYLWLKF